MGKRMPDYHGNTEALNAMRWPLAKIVPNFMAGMLRANEVTLRKVLHRMKIEDAANGGQEYRIRQLEKEILKRERSVGIHG